MTSGSSPLTKDFRSDINGLRALAVALVVLFHFGVTGFGGGYAGVDIFFVISGYLMTGIIVSRGDQPNFIWKFYLSRAKRIFPALFVLVAVTTVACWWILNPADYRQFADQARSSLLFFSNVTYANEAGYFDQAAHSKWLLHTWSLSVEWQFYIVLPIAILILRKLVGSDKAMFWVLALGAGYLYVSGGLRAEENPVWHFYSLKSRAWELLAGGLVYLGGKGMRPPARQNQIAVLGVALIAVGIVLAAQKPIWPGWLALIPVAGAALVILAARETILSNNRVVTWI